MHDAKLMDGRFEVNMPVKSPGYRRNRFYRWGMFPEKTPGVMRMQDEAGQAPADRRWSDVRSDARDDRLQTRNADWIAAMVDGAVEIRPGNTRPKCLPYAGEPQSTQGGTRVITSPSYPPPAGRRGRDRRPADRPWITPGHQLMASTKRVVRERPRQLPAHRRGLGVSFSVLIVAEMMGVKAGLGWYLQWAQGWAAYSNMYAALLVMALMCSGLITLLFRFRDCLLVWQKGLLKW